MRADALRAARAGIDLDALLVALVMVPTSYPRNRFYELHKLPAVKRVRRRAANLRSIVADLIDGADGVAVATWGSGFELRYALPGMLAERRARLDARELALVAAVVRRTARDKAGELVAAVGESAIAELTPVLARLLGDA